MPIASPVDHDPRIEAQVFWLRFQKEIIAVLIMAVLAAVGYAGYRFYSERENSAAATMLASAKKAPDFQQVIAKYPKTPAGASAHLLLAQAQRTEKDFTGSNATLQQFIAKYPKHELVTSARIAMGANFESMSKADDALSTYQQIASAYPRDFNAPLALISQVRLLKAKNQPDAARRVCETLLTQYRESFWANEAMRELRALKPSEPAQPPARSTTVSPPGSQAPPMLARPAAPAPAVAPTMSPKKKK
jgi:predicted negative regulator of RcsB-dependent stress response